MPYYSVERPVQQCPEIGCKRAATFEVRTPTNETIGRWCKQHADRRVEDLNEDLRRRLAGQCAAPGCVVVGDHQTHVWEPPC